MDPPSVAGEPELVDGEDSRSRRRRSSEHKHRHKKHRQKDRRDRPDEADGGSGPEDGEIVVPLAKVAVEQERGPRQAPPVMKDAVERVITGSEAVVPLPDTQGHMPHSKLPAPAIQAQEDTAKRRTADVARPDVATSNDTHSRHEPRESSRRHREHAEAPVASTIDMPGPGAAKLESRSRSERGDKAVEGSGRERDSKHHTTKAGSERAHRDSSHAAHKPRSESRPHSPLREHSRRHTEASSAHARDDKSHARDDKKPVLSHARDEKKDGEDKRRSDRSGRDALRSSREGGRDQPERSRHQRDAGPSDRHRSDHPARGSGAADREERVPPEGGAGEPRGHSGRKRSRSPGGHAERDRQRRRDRARSPSPQVDDAKLSKKLLAAMTSAADMEPEDDEQRIIEERRRRVAEIKAKHQQQQAAIDSVITPTASELPHLRPAEGGQQNGVADSAALAEPHAAAAGETPAAEDVAMQDAEAPVVDDGDATPEGERSSTSDDEGNADGPVLDIWAQRVVGGDEVADAGGPGALAATALSREPGASQGAQPRGGPAPATSAGVDDMFAEELPVDVLGAGPAGGDAGERRTAALVDAYDDAEGYYKFQVGELMDNQRYEAISESGKGVFSNVVRARDRHRTDESGRHPEVAIKLIRANETMHKAAQVEQSILRRLGEKDPDNRKHCIRLLRTFTYRNHSCLVFESMDLNMRELTKKYGRNVGLSLDAVGMYACQLLVALRHLKRNGILHADIKPDNILVNARRTKVKLCDFGSAMEMGDVEVTPYLVSRFYRAPEVILGLKYDAAMDMWSLGCVLFELCTGRILFPGSTNNAMLKLMMDVKGPFPRKMLKKAAFVAQHFEDDPSMSFAMLEDDPVTGRPIRKLVANPTVKAGFAAQLAQRGGAATSTSERLKLAQLADLLDKMMVLDPEKRMDPDTALRHAFVKEYLPKHGHHGAAGDKRGRKGDTKAA